MSRRLDTPADFDRAERVDHDRYYGDDYDREIPTAAELARDEASAGSTGPNVITGHTHDRLPGITCVPCITEGRQR